MRLRSPQPSAPRPDWAAYARTLAVLAIGYNLLEGLVSMGFGWAGGSLSLFGFGADSLIEVGTSVLVLWRLGDAGPGSRRERGTALAIGFLFLLLAAGTAAAAALQLAARRHPATTLPGLAVAVVCAGVMAFLWRAKKNAAQALGSRALTGDATCSLVCMQLSAVLFLGSLVFRLWPSLWWTDAAAALVLAGYIGREGWELAAAARKPQFEGGCGCH